MKRLYFLLGLLLIACTNQTQAPNEGIVLGVVRGWINLPDTYVVGTNGAGKIEAPVPPNLNSQPEWSPDGHWIISSTRYEESKPEDSAIYLMRSDGSQRSLVIHDVRGSFDPAWSPDGKHIVYYARSNQTGIFTLNIECFQLGPKCDSEPTFLTIGDLSPDWSPDGKQIVYAKKGNIFVVSSDGSGQPINLTSAMTNCFNPKWSPNETQIVFSCYQIDHHDIFVVNANGSDLINLTNGIGSNIQPNWSPDGSKIAFVSNRDGLGQILGIHDTVRSNAVFLMNADGTNLIRLSLRDDENVLWYAWLPPNISETKP